MGKGRGGRAVLVHLRTLLILCWLTQRAQPYGRKELLVLRTLWPLQHPCFLHSGSLAPPLGRMFVMALAMHLIGSPCGLCSVGRSCKRSFWSAQPCLFCFPLSTATHACCQNVTSIRLAPYLGGWVGLYSDNKALLCLSSVLVQWPACTAASLARFLVLQTCTWSWQSEDRPKSMTRATLCIGSS